MYVIYHDPCVGGWGALNHNRSANDCFHQEMMVTLSKVATENLSICPLHLEESSGATPNGRRILSGLNPSFDNNAALRATNEMVDV